jgi:hypothetical protein
MPVSALPFGRVLNDLAAGEAQENLTRLDWPTSSYAFNNTALPLGAVAPCGDATGWDKAVAWIADLAEPEIQSVSTEAVSSDPKQVARELALHVAVTVGDLQRIRREFMWANHPDRCPHIASDIANQRVATANMLIDEAVRELTHSAHAAARSD